jgi:membrane protein required for colicin V production
MLRGFGDSLIAALPDNLEEQLNQILKRGGAAIGEEPLDDTTPPDTVPPAEGTVPPAQNTTPPADVAPPPAAAQPQV